MCKNGSTIMTGHRYRNAPAAIEWLTNVFGFERRAVYEGENGSIAHAELTLGSGMIMLGSGKDDAYGKGFKTPAELDGIETRSVYMVVTALEGVRTKIEDAADWLRWRWIAVFCAVAFAGGFAMHWAVSMKATDALNERQEWIEQHWQQPQPQPAETKPQGGKQTKSLKITKSGQAKQDQPVTQTPVPEEQP
ncbi:MAG: hypothetical protein ABR905_18055 [Terracidiphilus sp.]|jgi:uncharacterized glyoxalase superfamily protein PhnB